MILVDYNHAMILAIMGATASKKSINTTSKEQMHKVFLQYIISIRKKYHTRFGELVICCDGDSESWRKKEFPLYKAARKLNKKVSHIDWPMINSAMKEFREILSNHFPYKVIVVDNAEADDVIAVLAKTSKPPTLIYSSDTDFLQLQKYGVEQYAPQSKKFIISENPELTLKEKIIQGDSGDGIPNILSPENIFLLEGQRQTQIRSAKLKEWLTKEPEEFCDDEMLKKYRKNQRLIDFDFIPPDIINRIESEFAKEKEFVKNDLFLYLMNSGNTEFLTSLQEI